MQAGLIEAADDRKARERLCIVTRQVRPVSTLIRFVLSPDGIVTPDLKRSLPGRGVWVGATKACVGEAIRKKSFTRAFKRPVDIPEDLLVRLDQLLEKAALDMLSMANKAGLVLAGSAKVLGAIESRAAIALLQAHEASQDGIRKLAQAARRAYVEEKTPVTITNFNSAHLNLALGRTNVIHAALCAGPAATGFLDRVAALSLWRDGGLVPAGSQPAGVGPLQASDDSSTQDDVCSKNSIFESLIEPGLPVGFGTE